MLILGLLGLILIAACIIHAIKTGRTNYWLMIQVLLPGVGSLAYLVFEVWPEARHSRRGHAEDRDIADTADNKRHFAEECIKRAQWDEAIKLYRSALVGALANDPALMIGLARTLFGRGDYQASLDTLEELQKHNPGYQSREGHLIYARALEMLDRTKEAAFEYRALVGYALGPEAQVRYGLLMKQMGETDLAEEAFREAVKTYGRRDGQLKPADREWIAEAERQLA